MEQSERRLSVSKMNSGREAKGQWLDLAGLVLLAVVAMTLVILALFDYSLGRAAWPFAVGAVVGDALMYLAIKHDRFRTPVLIFAFFLLVAGFVAVFVRWSDYMDLSAFSVTLPWEVPLGVAKFATGLLGGFGGIVLTGFFWPTLYSPETWDEAVLQRRATVRDVLIVGGIFTGLVLLALLLLGFSALVVWISVNFG